MTRHPIWQRRSLPLPIVALLLVALATQAPTPAAAAPLPNVIFILADDIGYGDLGCYGATKHRTPHCDHLAREGVRFTDGHAPKDSPVNGTSSTVLRPMSDS